MSDTPTPEAEEAQPPGPVPEEAAVDAEAPPEEPAAAAPEVVPPAAEEQSDDEEELELSEIEARLLDDMDRLQAERNDYLDQLLRTRADFDNYRKRVVKQQADVQERAAEALIAKLLGALDTLDMAVAHGQGFEQGRDSLVNVLVKEGLEKIDPVGEVFDPTVADAVAHEEGDGGPVVVEVLRPGYRWKGRVLRPAMVKVKG